MRLGPEKGQYGADGNIAFSELWTARKEIRRLDGCKTTADDGTGLSGRNPLDPRVTAYRKIWTNAASATSSANLIQT